MPHREAKLYAISDLHLRHASNRRLLEQLAGEFEHDWLIVAGDVGETEAHLRFAFGLLQKRFAKLFWVPGNHELWTLPHTHRVTDTPAFETPTDSAAAEPLRGEARYKHLIGVCRQLGVVTPEDPYSIWPGHPTPHLIAPLFLLYDYSFGPEGMSEAESLGWAAEERLLCADERYLHPTPYPNRAAWCMARCEATANRLIHERHALPTVLINHWPLREDLAVLPRIPRFKIWCGTQRTANWHVRFGASVVVYGHLHIRRTCHRDGVRFEEVSLGYPNQYRSDRGLAYYLREILPGR